MMVDIVASLTVIGGILSLSESRPLGGTPLFLVVALLPSPTLRALSYETLSR